VRLLAACLAVIALAGCGAEVPAVAPVRVPAEAAAACREAARSEQAPVLCPPGGGAPAPVVRLIHADLDGDPCVFVQNLETLRPDPSGRRPSHLLYGTSCEPFTFGVRPDGRWDIEPPLSLRLAGSPPLVLGQPPRASLPHVVGRVSVRGRTGLLLRADPFPEGGTNGSHYGLAWNEAGAAHQVSAHYPSGDRGRDPSPAQRQALLEFAARLR
jgi:hypothetical protein